MTNYNNDQPISSECDDKLNRKLFAQEIANLLILDDGDPCLTVSIEGQWGQGKTSILNMVQEAFSKTESHPIVVTYNAWVNGKSESLIQDFLIQFTAQLGLTDHTEESKKIAEELLSYSKLFSVAKLIPGVEPWGSLIENIFNSVGGATQSISNLKELNVTDKKAQVSKRLKRLNKPIVVIIDDIDRLTPEECFQVLRLVKAVADFPRTAFILAFEPSYLESVLASNKIDNSSEYIDKIVQLRIPLPTITSKDLDSLIDACFENDSSNFNLNYYEDDRDRLSYIYQRYLRYIITSPRDVNRVFNHFKFVYRLVKNQVCITDLFILSVISTKAHRIYSHIKSNPTLYSGKQNSGDLDYRNKEKALDLCKQQRSNIYIELGINEDNTYEDLLNVIFPSINKKSYHPYQAYDADAAGRVDHINRLSTALHISTPRGSVSDQDVADFIESSGQNLDILNNAISNESTKRFLEIFEIQYEKLDLNVLEKISIIRVIIDILLSKGLLDGYKTLYTGFFVESSIYDSICRLFNLVLRETDDKENIILSAINESTLLPFVANSIKRLNAQHSERNYELPWLEEKIVNDITSKYIIKAQEALISEVFNSKALEYYIMSPLWIYDEPIALSTIKSLEQRNVLRIGWLLIGNLGADSNKGNYLSVNFDKAKSVLDIKKLKQDAQALDLNQLTSENTAVILSIIDGKAHYITDGEVVRD